MPTALDRLSRDVAALQRQIDALSTPQLDLASVELSSGEEMSLVEGLETASQIAADMADVVERLTSAEGALDGIVSTTFSDTAPADPSLDDLWWNTATGIPSRYDGSEWVEVRDQGVIDALEAAAAAEAAVDGKITTFYDNVEPTSGMSEGDLWIKTPGNVYHRYTDGLWTILRAGSDAIEDEAITGQKIKADAFIGKKYSTGESGPRFEFGTELEGKGNYLLGYTADEAAAPSGLVIDDERGNVSLYSPDYGDGDGPQGSAIAALGLYGSKDWGQSMADLKASLLRLSADDSLSIGAGGRSSIDVSGRALDPRINFSTQGPMNLDTKGGINLGVYTAVGGGGTVQSRIQMYGTNIGLTGVVNGFKSTELRAEEFLYTDASVGTTTSTTGAAMGARGGSGFFKAPPSGVVKIDYGGQTKASADGAYAGVGIEVRSGSTVGSGSIVRAYSVNDAVLNYFGQWQFGMTTTVLTGLTPGANYNVRSIVSSSTGTASFVRGRFVVIPQP